MPRKTCVLLLCIFYLAILFSGCGDGEIQMETQFQTESIQPSALEYSYPNLDFSLTIPEEWAERYEISQEKRIVTVSLDDTPTLSFTSVPNEVGAREEDRLLEEDGYICHRQNGTHFFYYKIHEPLPKELYLGLHPNKSRQWHTEQAISRIWRINCETEVCYVVLDNDSYYLSMKSTEYINHRLAISFKLPETFLSNNNVRLYPSDEEGTVSVMLWDTTFAKQRAYRICTILAMPVDDPLRNAISLVDYPDLIFHDGKLYGGINNWQPAPGDYGRQWVPENYPEDIQNTFTFEEVQEVVESFCLLFPPDELEEALKMEPSELEPYLTTP